MTVAHNTISVDEANQNPATGSDILVSGRDLLGADPAVTITGDVSPNSITLGGNLTRDNVAHSS